MSPQLRSRDYVVGHPMAKYTRRTSMIALYKKVIKAWTIFWLRAHFFLSSKLTFILFELREDCATRRRQPKLPYSKDPRQKKKFNFHQYTCGSERLINTLSYFPFMRFPYMRGRQPAVNIYAVLWADKLHLNHATQFFFHGIFGCIP